MEGCQQPARCALLLNKQSVVAQTTEQIVRQKSVAYIPFVERPY